ncbi:ABC transporter permease [Nocardioides insulae]|uniref:ABC transporter permease n=1 Tax=Nocardioides insulae TaxID=394734 RepID=UPI0003F978C0|nr:ABC transporter permease [Nocardioides insulae]
MSSTLSALEGEQLPEPAEPDEGAAQKVAGKSPMRLAAERFRKDKLSMVSMVIVVIYLLMAILAPFMVKFGVIDPYTLNQDLLDANTLPKGDFGGISADHPLGIVPGTGWDLMSRLWYGITFSLAISLLATIVAMTLGVVLGIVAGFSRGWVDMLIGRAIDLTLSFPQTLMLLALSSLAVAFLTDYLHVPEGNIAQGLYVVLVLGLFGWPSIARIIRGQVLSIREREFVDAAQLLGASKLRIYFKELLPNLWAPVLVTFTLTMPAYISAEAALSYLGVSIKPPTPTLGNILRDSLLYAESDFVYFFAPAFLICIIVVSFNLLGDGLRDALDPKSSR